MPPKAELKVGIFFVLPFHIGRAKKIPARKTLDFPGFFHFSGAKKHKVFPQIPNLRFFHHTGLELVTSLLIQESPAAFPGKPTLGKAFSFQARKIEHTRGHREPSPVPPEANKSSVSEEFGSALFCNESCPVSLTNRA